MTADLDLLDRLLEHDIWTTRQVMHLCSDCSEAQLDQPFDLGHQTVRATLLHMIANIETWTRLMEGSLLPNGGSDHPGLGELQQRHQAASQDFARLARRLRDQGQLAGLYWDTLDQPPRQKSYAGTILHVITHNHMHRADVLHMLQRLGVPGLIEGDVLSWEAAQTPGS